MGGDKSEKACATIRQRTEGCFLCALFRHGFLLERRADYRVGNRAYISIMIFGDFKRRGRCMDGHFDEQD